MENPLIPTELREMWAQYKESEGFTSPANEKSFFAGARAVLVLCEMALRSPLSLSGFDPNRMFAEMKRIQAQVVAFESAAEATPTPETEPAVN